MLTNDEKKKIIESIFRVMRDAPPMDKAEALSIPFWLFEELAIHAIKQSPQEAEYLIQRFSVAFDESIENVYEVLSLDKPRK